MLFQTIEAFMFGGIGIWQLLIILLIVVLLFGTKKLKSMGKDMGEAVKGFKDGIKDDSSNNDQNVESKPKVESKSNQND